MFGVDGQRVEVYRNVRTGTYSIRHKGKVVGHLDEAVLRDCTLVVQPAGNRKVRQEQRKNVHAYVRGFLAAPADVPPAVQWTPAQYNPYQNTSFVRRDTKETVAWAEYVALYPRAMLVTGTDVKEEKRDAK